MAGFIVSHWFLNKNELIELLSDTVYFYEINIISMKSCESEKLSLNLVRDIIDVCMTLFFAPHVEHKKILYHVNLILTRLNSELCSKIYSGYYPYNGLND